MKWTRDQLEILRQMADEGKSQAQAAKVFGVKTGTIASVASRNRIKFHFRTTAEPGRDFAAALRQLREASADPLRQRWRAALPAMRQRVRDEVRTIMRGGSQ